LNPALQIRSGSLYIDAATFARSFGAREAVALLRRDEDFWIVPLASAVSGGYLCKRRTAAGDRVIHADDFFREQGLGAAENALEIEAMWNADAGAFVVPAFFGASA
jgi:hypothetical protein